MGSFKEALDPVGDTEESHRPFMVQLGPFQVSIYYYSIPGLESGWQWRVSGRAGSNEPFKTMNDAKWDLAHNIWDMVSPLRLFAEKQKRKGRDSSAEDST